MDTVACSRKNLRSLLHSGSVSRLKESGSPSGTTMKCLGVGNVHQRRGDKGVVQFDADVGRDIQRIAPRGNYGPVTPDGGMEPLGTANAGFIP